MSAPPPPPGWPSWLREALDAPATDRQPWSSGLANADITLFLLVLYHDQPARQTLAVGGAAVGEALGELHDGDQGELPGEQRGPSAARVEVGEVAVAEDGAERVAEPEVGVSLGEGGAGDVGGTGLGCKEKGHLGVVVGGAEALSI
jgi:hypothetical protein